MIVYCYNRIYDKYLSIIVFVEVFFPIYKLNLFKMYRICNIFFLGRNCNLQYNIK